MIKSSLGLALALAGFGFGFGFGFVETNKTKPGMVYESVIVIFDFIWTADGKN